MVSENTIIAQTIAWIRSVVIGCHFCPFAAKAIQRKSIRFVVLSDADVIKSLEKLKEELSLLDQSADIETTLIILPEGFDNFMAYLDLVRLTEKLVVREGYEGIYQIASFHPEYCFADAAQDDPANYTNRSIYPMVHILREESVSQAVDHYPDAEKIPDVNMAYAREKGLKYMQSLRAACINL